MIPATGDSLNGVSYSFLDNAPEAANAPHYFIEDIDIYGRVMRHGPIVVERPGREAPTRGRKAIRTR